MIVVPKLRTYKNVLPFDLPLLEHRLHGFAHVFLISVAFGAIELTKAYLQRDPDCLFCCDRIRNQRAKAERRNLIGAIVERYLCITKAVGVSHKTLTSVQIADRVDCNKSLREIDYAGRLDHASGGVGNKSSEERDCKKTSLAHSSTIRRKSMSIIDKALEAN